MNTLPTTTAPSGGPNTNAVMSGGSPPRPPLGTNTSHTTHQHTLISTITTDGLNTHSPLFLAHSLIHPIPLVNPPSYQSISCSYHICIHSFIGTVSILSQCQSYHPISIGITFRISSWQTGVYQEHILTTHPVNAFC